MACIFCGHANGLEIVATETRDSANHTVRRCPGCSLTQLDPAPSESQSRAYYDENRQQKSVEPNISLDEKIAKTRADTERRRTFVAELLGDAESFLDVGCGYGFLVAALREAGIDACGFEPGRARARIAAEQVGVPLIPAEAQAGAPRDGQSFDCIGLFQVLEHIADPMRSLRWLAELGHAGTRLVVEVPNLDDHMLEMSPEYRAFYWQEAHVAYYDASSLRMVLEASGWRVDDLRFVQRYSVLNAMTWLVRGRPQLEKPAYAAPAGLEWLDECYRSHLIGSGRTDTIVALARRDSAG